MGSEHGQAAVEWIGVVLLVALALGALLLAGLHMDGRSLGGFLAHRIVCAARGGCGDGDVALARAYGKRDAELVRRNAPNMVYEHGEPSLPVDYRRCRSRRCSDAPDDHELDAHRTSTGQRATVFVHVIRRGGRRYIQYWFYYPDSNTTWMGSDKLWRASSLPLVSLLLRGRAGYPGFHPDDWEGYQVRVDRDGRTFARATSHGHYQGCKQAACHNRWVPATGWTRVSRGSHAGHLPVDLLGLRPLRLRPRYPGVDIRERTTTGEGLRLVPLERVDRRGYRPRGEDGIAPPWRKRAYGEPEGGSS
jgi:hypothetical protein